MLVATSLMPLGQNGINPIGHIKIRWVRRIKQGWHIIAIRDPNAETLGSGKSLEHFINWTNGMYGVGAIKQQRFCTYKLAFMLHTGSR